MRTGLLLLAGLFSFASTAQSRFLLADYLPNRAGDTLQLRYALPAAKSDEPMLFTFEAAPEGMLKQLLNGNSFQLWSIDSLHGWAIHQMGEAEGFAHVLEKPLLLAPAVVEQGGEYSGQSAYTTFEKGRRTGSGLLTAVVRVHGHDSSSSHLRNFGDCLVITTTFEHRRPGGVVIGQELKQWLARGVGVVKIAGTRYRKNESGQLRSSEKLAALLEKAFVGGERL